MDSAWEKNIYSQGKQLNLYPYDLVVSLVARKFFHIPKAERKDIKVLDLGCGAGNNTKFLAESGFDTYGIDGSASAIEICQRRFREWGLPANFQVGNFLELPYEDNSFDLVLDRESLYANRLGDIEKTVREIYKKLKTGGVLFSFMYSKDHPDFGRGKEVEVNTFDMNTDQSSSMYGTGLAHFTDLAELRSLFSDFTIENIMEHSLVEKFEPENRMMDHTEFITIAKKV